MPYTITNKTYRKESILIMALSQTMQNALKSYIDLDFLDELSVPRQKKDGNFYSVYTAELQPEYATLAVDRSSVILKEISPKQAVVYRTDSDRWRLQLLLSVSSKESHKILSGKTIPFGFCSNTEKNRCFALIRKQHRRLIGNPISRLHIFYILQLQFFFTIILLPSSPERSYAASIP